ncbi:MAG: TetR/AcrR family transcriptional regulator [Mycobacterium sp.]|nr:MAG: TetR/AcrR family transcriptional regulator [Mycobacterium sp.]
MHKPARTRRRHCSHLARDVCCGDDPREALSCRIGAQTRRRSRPSLRSAPYLGRPVPIDPHELQPRKRPQQQRSQQTREHILEAAIDVFTEYGYARGTTNRIAERAEISIGSLYQYYPNKDAIVIDLATRHLDNGVADFNRRRQTGSADTLEAVLHDMVGTAIDNHRHDPEYLRLLIEQAPRSGELMAKVAALQDASSHRMRDLLATYPEVVVEDLDTAARLTVTTIELVVHHMLAAPSALDTGDLHKELVAMLTRYLTGD